MEALKVRMQTSKPGTYPSSFLKAFNKLRVEEGKRKIKIYLI